MDNICIRYGQKGTAKRYNLILVLLLVKFLLDSGKTMWYHCGIIKQILDRLNSGQKNRVLTMEGSKKYKKTDRTEVPPIRRKDKMQARDNKLKVETFANHLESTYTSNKIESEVNMQNLILSLV